MLDVAGEHGYFAQWSGSLLQSRRGAELFALLAMCVAPQLARAQAQPVEPEVDAGAESAPEPDPEPPPPPPAAPAPAVPPPQPAYPYPYPYAPYPYSQYPPGYAPPPGYPMPGYGYPYYAPPRPPPKPEPRYPDDAAAQTSPFFDAMIGGTSWNERFSSYFNVGVEPGLFILRRVRVAARIQMFGAEANDESSQFEEVTPGFFPEPSEDPSLLWGASVGFALVSTSSFVMSPGILFMRTDLDAYGNFLGLAVPFEWVSGSSIRIGFEIALGRAFGGDVRATCSSAFTGAPTPTACEQGEIRDFNRPAGTGLYAHFHMGLGLNHPGPLPKR